MRKRRTSSRRSRALPQRLVLLIVILLLYFAADYFLADPDPGPEQPPAISGQLDEPSPGAPASAPQAAGDIELHFIDVGQADCTLILCGGQSLLVDGGNREDVAVVCDYLAALEVDRLDYVACTHAHEDHAGGLSGLLRQVPAAVALAPYDDSENDWFNDFIAVAGEQGTDIVVARPGDEYQLGAATVEVLGPLGEYDNINDTSLVLRVVYEDAAFLLTGDATTQAEGDMLDAGLDLSADVLKTGHHGSNGSSGYRFLREVMPSYAIISCGAGNSYGHPGEKTMSRLRDEEAVVYRTDELGSIICRSDGSVISFEFERQP